MYVTATPKLLLALFAALAAVSTGFAQVSIVDRSVSPTRVTDSDTITVRYRVAAERTQTAILETRLVRNGIYVPDSRNDRTVTLQAGTHWYERSFVVNLPPAAPTGAYAVHYRLLDPQTRAVLASQMTEAAVQVAAPLPLTVPILSYGKIGPVEHSKFWVTSATFRSHMRALADQGYVTVTLQDVMDFRAGRRQPPAKAVVLTFLNGFRHLIDEVDPVLREHGFVATSFILPHHVGGTNRWDPGDSVPEIAHLSWNEMRGLLATGRWDFQSGSYQHVDLRVVGANEAREEARRSREAIEQQLNRPALFFSYPWGHGSGDSALDRAIQQEVWGQGYVAGLGFRLDVSVSDKWSLPRFDLHNRVHVDPNHSTTEWYLFGPYWLGRGSALPPPDYGPTEGRFHPADTNGDWRISVAELTAFGAAWRSGATWRDGSTITISYLTRAGLIWRTGGPYRHDPAAGADPATWIPAGN